MNRRLGISDDDAVVTTTETAGASTEPPADWIAAANPFDPSSDLSELLRRPVEAPGAPFESPTTPVASGLAAGASATPLAPESGRGAGGEGEAASRDHVPGSISAVPPTGVIIGTLVAFLEGRTPLVVHPDHPDAAMPARTTIDLAPTDIGSEVVLQFERGDVSRPIILGRLRQAEAWPLRDEPAQVHVDADGQRLTVDAKEEITLRCGKASITLTRAGKVLINGTYVSQRSSGVMRIKGGSVQLN